MVFTDKVDVVLLTKNSEYLLGKCINSIYQNIPVNNLIVVDGFSTDRTLSIIKKFNKIYKNVKIYKTTGTRARARELGISKVSTEWFAFVDSDVVLCKNWFKKAKEDFSSNVGAVWGLNIDIIPNLKQKWIILLQSMIARQCFDLRGGMHDTLIRTETVKDLKIPPELHAFEDTFLAKAIKKQGFKVKAGSDVYCLHYKPPTNWSFQNMINQAIVEFKCGVLKMHMAAYSLFYPVFMFYWFLQLPLSGFREVLSR